MKLLKNISVFAACMGTFTLLYSECIDETTTTTYGKECTSTVCDSNDEYGNCIDFHCDYSTYSNEKVDCHEYADIKECKSWDIDTQDEEPTTTESICCKFDVSNGSCLDTCDRLTQGLKTVHKKCTRPVYN